MMDRGEGVEERIRERMADMFVFPLEEIDPLMKKTRF